MSSHNEVFNNADKAILLSLSALLEARNQIVYLHAIASKIDDTSSSTDTSLRIIDNAISSINSLISPDKTPTISTESVYI